MLKKLILIGILLYSSTIMGLNAVSADETQLNYDPGIAAADNSPLEFTEGNKPSRLQEHLYAGNQGNSNKNLTENNTIQNQTTTPHVTQNQDVKGNPDAQQEQNATIMVCQQQSGNLLASCESNNAGSNENSASQSQTTSILAAQLQAGSTSGQTLNAEQNQAAGTESTQNQIIQLPDGESVSQNQGTSISTNQRQFLTVTAAADIWQGQLTNVFNSQNQMFDSTGSTANKQKLSTIISLIQMQNVSTPGSVILEQIQSASVNNHYLTDTERKVPGAGVTVKTLNHLEIAKDTTHNMVKSVQEVFVNNELVDVFKQRYSLRKLNFTSHPQDFQKQYEWGNLNVTNLTDIHYNADLHYFEAALTGYVNFIVNGTLPCKED